MKLQGQPFDLLAALMERPGEVVTREELKEKVWPSDTIVDFDQGLNRAVNKIRDALGDSAQSPQFLETLPRRGYRFIAPVQTMHNFVAAPTPEPVELPASSTAEVVQEAEAPIPTAASMPGLSRRWKLAAILASVLAVVAVWAWKSRGQTRSYIGSIAVLPLQNLSGDPGQEYFVRRNDR